MSDTGDGSQHKRSKSSVALSLLRRDKTREDNPDSGSEDGRSATGNPSAATSAPPASASDSASNMAHQSSVRSQTGSRLAPTTSAQPAATPGKTSPVSDKSAATLEQSVKKFRVVEALRSGDTATISRAIRENGENGPRTSISSWAGGAALEDTTILHLAIQCAEYPVVEYVLSDGQNTLDLNARDKDGNTPLHIAAMQGRTPCVKLLLDQKDINDAATNIQGKMPIDLARNPDIFQLLQLSRSLFTDAKVKQVQALIVAEDYDTLAEVLEEPRLKTVIDINSPEFASEPSTVQSGGTLLHEAARKKNTKLIQILLLHGADPFRRDRKGKLPQNITSDDAVKAILKRSPAAVAAQRGIQEKAVLGHAASQGGSAAGGPDALAGREARETKGYLKKWTNYRKGYQLRWFVLEDGVLSYYKHQDDAGSACRGAINMRIARLHMSPDEKTKFEIIGKSSVKYTLKANHEVEAKRWFWSLNNSIQWTKDQAREEEKQAARDAELLKQAKAEQQGGALSVHDSHSENASVSDARRNSSQYPARSGPGPKVALQRQDTLGASTVASDDEYLDAGTEGDAMSRMASHMGGPMIPGEHDDDDDYADQNSGAGEDRRATKDALNITAQSAKLQLETMTQVHSALLNEVSQSPATTVSDTKVTSALSTYDAAIRSLTGLIGDLLRISKDRDAYWQYRLDREANMRRMWEDSMAKVAREQEELVQRVDEAEMKRRLTKKALREVMETGAGPAAASAEVATDAASLEAPEPPEPASMSRRQTIMEQIADLSDEDESDAEEFFDAVDAGEVEVAEMPPEYVAPDRKDVVVVKKTGATDISTSFKGYEGGIRTRLKMDEDNRPKVSLWGVLKSLIGQDMTKMTLPVSLNEPTSLLYRNCEDMEYADLLDLAAERTDSIERMIYVAAFATSEFASALGRVAKPFNPLLGETFEYVRPDKGYRFFTEQISHHPPIGAAWAEGGSWTYWGESNVRSKFLGKSFDINHLGTWFLRLQPASGGQEDLYTWKKVSQSVIGIITGNPTVDNYGPMEIKNWTTGETAQLEFKPRGWKASSAYHLTGKILDAQGKVRVSMGGRWNSRLYARLTPGYETTMDEPAKDSNKEVYRGSMNDPSRAYLVWSAHARPDRIPFNLTPFAVTFNHLDEHLRPWLAPTDSRLRPDQRAMEEGEYDFAATEKNRLEQNQRSRRRIREENGEAFAPAWFTRRRCEVTGESYWHFDGRYWDQREKAGPDGDPEKAWAGLEPIYS